jgi:alpha-tubulin suppressor-like RCC1 family protein
MTNGRLDRPRGLGQSRLAGARLGGLAFSLVLVGTALIAGCGHTSRNAGSSQAPSSGGWVRASCGGLHTAALKTGGTLWTWGSNQWGQLGTGVDATQVDVPVEVDPGSRWLSVSCGWDHTVAVKADGTLWAWGDNGSGELGVGDTRERTTPTRVGNASDWANVSCGWDHSAAVKKDGTLWTWGANDYGQLGTGRLGGERTVPTRVGTAHDWAAVSCGDLDMIALKTDGTLWACGSDLSGELGLGSGGDRATLTEIGTAHDWAAVSCGGLHVAALKRDGTLWVWGDNSAGELGVGDTRDRAVPTRASGGGDWAVVSCGALHTAAIRSDGTLWTWGYDYGGELGLGGGRAGLLLAGTVFVRVVPAQVGLQRDWVTVSCGTGHTAALAAGGVLWTWGNNHEGELGLGDTELRRSPVAVADIPSR